MTLPPPGGHDVQEVNRDHGGERVVAGSTVQNYFEGVRMQDTRL
jgi:hypothetical protein